MGLSERKWLLDNLPLLLREAQYHRDHEDAEELPAEVIWRWDDVETERPE